MVGAPRSPLSDALEADEGGRATPPRTDRTGGTLRNQALVEMVVHDLKNPVAGIQMIVQRALRCTEVPDAQRGYLLSIDRSCREMMQLIENLLEIGLVEDGRMPVALEAIGLAVVVGELTRDYLPLVEQTARRLVVALDPDLPMVIGDPVLLRRVLVNLLVNALRHSGSDEVRFEAAHDATMGEVTLRVVDHGRGIPPESQPQFFETHGSPPAARTGGTGLGLPFCKLAVERMGGRITCRSVPGSGAEFAITLPCAPDGARRAAIDRA